MENQKQQNRRRAAVVCALALAALGGAGAGAHAAPGAPTATAGGHSAGEVDRNMLKPPPGGVLAPVTDLAGGLLPG
ncbi:hypothetical protein ACH4E8_03315 [Streptomyces sp. NPDC017979]|uniref:hypothetical protein n=1 Tax=unclassified Streptomyces TaxID=2593676 RepID=UPI00379AA733